VTTVFGDADLVARAEQLGNRLQAVAGKLITAESCTGGFISQVITSLAGSSAWFECGYVTYSNAAKCRDLAVPRAVLAAHGAVSIQTAATMAIGALRRGGGLIALSVTGVAGPDGGSEDKPVGTVCFGWAHDDGRVVTERHLFPGDREGIRRATVAHALDGARSIL
jgi:nicotinamide-nucleotide amidase